MIDDTSELCSVAKLIVTLCPSMLICYFFAESWVTLLSDNIDLTTYIQISSIYILLRLPQFSAAACLLYQSFWFVLFLCAPEPGAYIHRPCIWPHWNFTSPWISPRCLPLLRRLTALLPLLAPQWGHKYPSLPCHRLRRSCAATPENCKSKRISLFYRSSRGLSATADSRKNVMNILIFICQGAFMFLAERETIEEKLFLHF